MHNALRGKNEPVKSVFDFMPADVEAIDPIEKTWENLRELAGDASHGEH